MRHRDEPHGRPQGYLRAPPRVVDARREPHCLKVGTVLKRWEDKPDWVAFRATLPKQSGMKTLVGDCEKFAATHSVQE